MNNDFLEDDLDIEDEEFEDESVAVNYDIASYPSDFTLSVMVDMWNDGEIIIPDYQREFVWSINQASLLIDSFLSGLPVPPVFFYVDEQNRNIVIDGQQRILSIVFYLEGYFGKESTHGRRQVFRLSGLNGKSPYANMTFNELDKSDQRQLSKSVLRALNIRQLNPSGEGTSAYHIFERLNTGGTPLKPQEIRNCVFRGEFNKMLKEANKDENWRKIIGKRFFDKHQKDVELLLRVFALTGASARYEKPMKEFLNQAMKKHDRGTTKKVENFFHVFRKVTEVIVEQMGEKPFHLRGPLNVSALDSVMSVMMENHRNLEERKLGYDYKKLRDNDEFIECTRINTTDTKTVKERIALVRKYMVYRNDGVL
ncbi:MAG: DUF262 domain-containing protein [Gammaproteobacteria bacterium]|nr:DUF262 domain-containing protein [Candidatus Poribacteria bacterium]MDE0364290.1 DUF262 domain-containing protein [Gammaproteobacteria bacterium]